MIYDPWQQLADECRSIEGLDLRCRKGRWSIDDEPFETGDDGAQLAVIMPSALIGEILWEDEKPKEIKAGRVEDGFIAAKPPLDDGWSPHTSVLVVFAGEKRAGQLGTFCSSSWGGRFAFQSLARPYTRKGKQAFPICTLHVKERGDQNNTLDPLFRIVGWTASPTKHCRAEMNCASAVTEASLSICKRARITIMKPKKAATCSSSSRTGMDAAIAKPSSGLKKKASSRNPLRVTKTNPAIAASQMAKRMMPLMTPTMIPLKI
jgi:hypothetical protein